MSEEEKLDWTICDGMAINAQPYRIHQEWVSCRKVYKASSGHMLVGSFDTLRDAVAECERWHAMSVERAKENRKAFEEWYTNAWDSEAPFRRHPGGTYRVREVEVAWDAWETSRLKGGG